MKLATFYNLQLKLAQIYILYVKLNDKKLLSLKFVPKTNINNFNEQFKTIWIVFEKGSPSSIFFILVFYILKCKITYAKCFALTFLAKLFITEYIGKWRKKDIFFLVFHFFSNKLLKFRNSFSTKISHSYSEQFAV